MALSPPTFAELVVAVPWLAEVPAALTELLDRSEYVVPSGDLDAIRRHLESVLGANVMTYRRHRNTPPTGPRQLCRLLAPAALHVDGVLELRRAEARFVDVLFCAYARPLRFVG